MCSSQEEYNGTCLARALVVASRESTAKGFRRGYVEFVDKKKAIDVFAVYFTWRNFP